MTYPKQPAKETLIIWVSAFSDILVSQWCGYFSNQFCHALRLYRCVCVCVCMCVCLGLRAVLQALMFSGSTVWHVGDESEKSSVSWMGQCPGHSITSPIRTARKQAPCYICYDTHSCKFLFLYKMDHRRFFCRVQSFYFMASLSCNKQI